MLAAPQPASATAPTVTCTEADVPVTALVLPATIHGQLCAPEGVTAKSVQLLLPGATFNRKYWDLPYKPDQYSYQRDMARNGLATFAVDPIGIGQSSRPLSALVTGAGQASAMHQVISALRAGKVGGTRFGKVLIGGHSAGSALSIIESATYHDVDGVLLTGMTHLPNMPVLLKDVAVGLQPVTVDPLLSSRGGDPGYLTSRPGERNIMYFSASDVEPGVVAADEQYAKDQVSAVSLVEIIGLGLVSPLSRSISVPVMLADGGNDTGFCGFLRDCSSAQALRAGEAPYFSDAAQLSVFVLPGAGHGLGLAENAADYRAATLKWLHEHDFA
ncbi:alpha/beta fold hydrolase [Kutzneria viridogrisea]